MPNNSKMVQDRDTYDGKPTVSRIMIYRTVPYSATLNDPYPRLQVVPLFDAEYLRNGTRYRYSI